jgi:hypothetical protein
MGIKNPSSASAPVRVFLTTGTSSTVEETFFLTDGGQFTAYFVSPIAYPSGIQSLIAVVAASLSLQFFVAASPLGYMDGSTAAAVAAYSGMSAQFLQKTGAMSLTPTNIVVPADRSGSTYGFTIFYQ